MTALQRPLAARPLLRARGATAITPPASPAVVSPSVASPSVVSPSVPEPTPALRARPGQRRYRRSVRGRNCLVSVSTPPLVAFAVAFFRWFVDGRFFATGDVVPIERRGLFNELGWLWTHGNSGGGSPSFEISRLSEMVLTRLVELVGGSGADAQRVWLSLCFAFAALGGATLGWALTRRATPTLVAGFGAAFNAYLLMQIPNPLPSVTIGVMGTLGAQIVAVARGGRSRPLRFALSTLSLSFLGLNPPLLYVCGAWLALVFAAAKPLAGGESGAHRRAAAMLGRAFPWALALNLWWMVFLVLALRRGGEGATIAANTDVVSWSWTQRRSTPGNVLTLLTHWGWGRTEYFPFSPGLENNLWAGTRWLMPLGVFLAPLLTRGSFRRLALWLVALVTVFVLVAKGVNAPLSGLNLWAYGNVPGLWLLRDPMAKIGTILVLLLCGGWALTLDGLGEKLERSRTRWLRTAPLVTAALAIAFPLPLWTGSVSRQETANGRIKHVELPAAWDEVAAVVNGSPLRGKALVLPLDDFYQVPTTWGMYGSDRVARRFVDRPVLFQRPGGYFGEAPAVVSMMRGVERAGETGDTEGVESLLRTLAVSHIVVRRDIDRHSPVRVVDMADGEAVIAGLAGAPGLRKVADTDVAVVYEFTSSEIVEVRRALIDASAVPAENLADVVVGGDDQLAFVSAPPADVEVVGHAGVTAWATGTLEIPTAGPSDASVTRRSLATPLYSVSADGAAGSRRLRLSEADTVQLDGDTLPSRPDIEVAVRTGEPAALRIDDRLIALSADVLVPVADGAHVAALAPGSSLLGPHNGLADCNRSDDRPLADLGFELRSLDGGAQLRAEGHAACLAFPARGVEPGPHLVSLQVRHGQGAAPRVCAWLEGPDRCATLPPVPTGEGWVDYVGAIDIPASTTAVKVVVYAETSDAHPVTVNAYRDVAFQPLETVGETEAILPERPRHEATLAGSSHQATVTLGGRSPTLSPLSAVKDCNRSDDRTLTEAGISSSPVPGEDPESAATLRAEAHSACVSALVQSFDPARSYEVSFEYRWSSGQAPRFCVYRHGPNGCDQQTSLRKMSEWTPQKVIVRPQDGVAGLELYLYGDGGRFGPTEVAFRKVSVRAVGAETIITRSTNRVDGAERSTVPKLEWRNPNPATYAVSVSGAAEPFVLILSEHYSADWAISGLPPGATARHLAVDGYRNGWLIDPGESVALTVAIEHTPSHQARWALLVSAVTLAAAAVASALGVARRARPARRHTHLAADPVPDERPAQEPT